MFINKTKTLSFILERTRKSFNETIDTLNKIIELGGKEVASINEEITRLGCKREDTQATITEAQSMKDNIEKLIGVK